jgi:hypothetical protein
MTSIICPNVVAQKKSHMRAGVCEYCWYVVNADCKNRHGESLLVW